MLVSCIIPVYNRSLELRHAVNSALMQTYRPIEIIIVDDGSTDETREVADELESKNMGVVFAVHQNNKGVGSARQAGLAHAKGDFIQFLDSDDILSPRKFELQVNGLTECAECDISYGKTRAYHIDRGGPVDVASRATGIRFDSMLPRILVERPWHTVTPLYRRVALDRIGPWTNLRQVEDWEYDMRLAALGVKLHYCDEFIAEQRHHEGERLCLGWYKSDVALHDLAEGLLLLHGHAVSANVGPEIPEMQLFAANMMFWARRCASRGLDDEAQRLFKCGSTTLKRQQVQWTVYRMLASLFGWRNAERLAALVKGAV